MTDKRSFKNRVMEVSGDAPKRKRKAAAAESTPDVVVTRVMVEEVFDLTCIGFIIFYAVFFVCSSNHSYVYVR